MKRKSMTLGESKNSRRSKLRQGQPKEIVAHPVPWIIRPDVKPPFRIDTLDDLLDIAWNYKGTQTEGGKDLFDWKRLWLLIPALTELKNMIAMESLKEGMVNFVLYYIQNLHLPPDGKDHDGDMLHTILSGPPGSGKTEVAKIIAKIYKGLGFLSTSNVIIVKRSDFIAPYTGQTEGKTKAILEKAKGGVLFIDEAYTLGGRESQLDSFSKVIVDMLNQHLSENKKDFVCIVAGYEDELDRCLFSINAGLKSRFPWHFQISAYAAADLLKIFLRRVRKEGWGISNDAITSEFFSRNISSFPAFGRDVDNLFLVCKTSHTRHIFGTTQPKRILTKEDVNEALKKYKSMKKTEKFPSYFI